MTSSNYKNRTCRRGGRVLWSSRNSRYLAFLLAKSLKTCIRIVIITKLTSNYSDYIARRKKNSEVAPGSGLEKRLSVMIVLIVTVIKVRMVIVKVILV